MSLAKPAAALALVLGLCLNASAALKSGDALPDLSRFGLEGKLPDGLKGKVVLLDFWASWCEPCKASFPIMDQLQKQYGSRGLVVLAVNVDEKQSDMRDFLKQNTVSFTVVRDAAQKLVAQAGITTMPSSLLIDGEGKVRFLHTGFHGEETRKQYEREIESLLQK